MTDPVSVEALVNLREARARATVLQNYMTGNFQKALLDLLDAADAAAEALETAEKERTRGLLAHQNLERVLFARIEQVEALAKRREEERDEIADELAHAYWYSCGCLAGGVGHAPGSDECPARSLLNAEKTGDTPKPSEDAPREAKRCGYHDVVCVSAKPCPTHGDGKPRSGGRHG
ncbi:MAG: hypothetical protein NUW01_03515 [Gemmatimonadaceae bacterium]|nr:hypothetical protein [Gemmatimonadaceae bacterium]